MKVRKTVPNTHTLIAMKNNKKHLDANPEVNEINGWTRETLEKALLKQNHTQKVISGDGFNAVVEEDV